MLIAAQIRAARSLLGWPARVLAEMACVHITTVQRLESLRGPLRGNTRTVQRIQHSLETAGVAFTNVDGPGVLLRALGEYQRPIEPGEPDPQGQERRSASLSEVRRMTIAGP